MAPKITFELSRRLREIRELPETQRRPAVEELSKRYKVEERTVTAALKGETPALDKLADAAKLIAEAPQTPIGLDAPASRVPTLRIPSLGSNQQFTGTLRQTSEEVPVVATSSETRDVTTPSAGTLALSFAGKLVSSPDGKSVIAYNEDRLTLVEVATATPLSIPTPGGLKIERAAFLPDGRLVVQTSEGAKVVLFRERAVSSGQATLDAALDRGDLRTIESFARSESRERVLAEMASVSINARTLIIEQNGSASKDFRADLAFDRAADGSPPSQLFAPRVAKDFAGVGLALVRESATPTGEAFKPDGGPTTAKVTGKDLEISRDGRSSKFDLGKTDPAQALAVSSDGMFVVVAQKDQITVVNTETGQRLQAPAPVGGVNRIAFRGAELLIGGDSGSFAVRFREPATTAAEKAADAALDRGDLPGIIAAARTESRPRVLLEMGAYGDAVKEAIAANPNASRRLLGILAQSPGAIGLVALANPRTDVSEIIAKPPAEVDLRTAVALLSRPEGDASIAAFLGERFSVPTGSGGVFRGLIVDERVSMDAPRSSELVASVANEGGYYASRINDAPNRSVLEREAINSNTSVERLLELVEQGPDTLRALVWQNPSFPKDKVPDQFLPARGDTTTAELVRVFDAVKLFASDNKKAVAAAVAFHPNADAALLRSVAQNSFDPRIVEVATARADLMEARAKTPGLPLPNPAGPKVTLQQELNFQRRADKSVFLDAGRNNLKAQEWEAYVGRFAQGDAVGVNGRIAPSGGARENGSVGPMDYDGRSPAGAILRRGRSGAFYAELQANPQYRRVFDEFNEKYKELADLPNASPALKSQLQIELYGALQKADPEAFSVLLERMEVDVQKRSDRLAQAIATASLSETPVKPYYPVVVLGSGPQGASFTTEYKLADPRAGILMIEGSGNLGGQFVGQGSQFNVNSTSKQVREGEVPAFGGNIDLNPVRGPVQPVGGNRYNPARAVAEATQLSAMTSGADILLGREILGIKDTKGTPQAGSAPGRYEILLSDGTSIFTDQPIIAGGIGKPKFIFGDSTNALIEAERALIDVKKPDAVPGILTVRDAFVLMEASAQGRNPYRVRDGKAPRTLLVGGRDTGYTFVEKIGGFGPTEGYTGGGRLDYTQLGELGPITWITGKDGFETCDEFFRGTEGRKGRRPRYGDVETLITPSVAGQRAKVTPVRAQLRGIEKLPSGEFQVTWDTFQANGQPAGSTRQVFDRVVLGNGYETGVQELVQGMLPGPGTLRENVVEVKGTPDGYNKEVAVANRIKEQDVYVLGPTLPVEARPENLTDDQNRGLAKAGENVVGLAYNTPRNRTLARDLAVTNRSDAKKQTTFIVAEAPVQASKITAAGVERDLPLPDVGQPLRMISNKYDDVRLQSALRAALGREQISTKGSRAPIVRVWVEVQPGTKNAVVRVQGLEEVAADRVIRELASDPWVMTYLGAFANAAPSKKGAETPNVTALALEATLAPDRDASVPILVTRVAANNRSAAWQQFRSGFIGTTAPKPPVVEEQF